MPIPLRSSFLSFGDIARKLVTSSVSLRVVIILYYSTPWEAKSEQVRKKVKYAMVWDMNKPEMLKGTLLDDVRVDSVISCLNMCTTSSTIAGYMAVVKTIR